MNSSSQLPTSLALMNENSHEHPWKPLQDSRQEQLTTPLPQETLSVSEYCLWKGVYSDQSEGVFTQKIENDSSTSLPISTR
jgi:hypothetical protein